MSMFSTISGKLKKFVAQGHKKFAIYPYGEIGIMVHDVLSKQFGIDDIILIDNGLSKYNPKIIGVDELEGKDYSEYIFFVTYRYGIYYDEIRNSLKKYVASSQIVDLFPNRVKAGKYSSGPMLLSDNVEKIGAFCNFAAGTCAVKNHAMDYISTHGFIYTAQANYEDADGSMWYFKGVQPHGIPPKNDKVVIGNDVWLARNVIITNGAKIGNGVIAAAGAVITKDVPDYAIVAGVPARIIRYRYTPEQIEALNRIQWWNWSDDEIRERYDDFYLPIEDFIRKYDVV